MTYAEQQGIVESKGAKRSPKPSIWNLTVGIIAVAAALTLDHSRAENQSGCYHDNSSIYGYDKVVSP